MVLRRRASICLISASVIPSLPISWAAARTAAMHLAFIPYLQFVAALVGLVALVPLSVWFATGSRVQAKRALRGYGFLLLVLLGIAAAGGLVGSIAALMR